MTALEIIEEANKAGIRLGLNGDKLAMKAPRKPPDDLLARLREHKLDHLEKFSALQSNLLRHLAQKVVAYVFSTRCMAQH